MLIAAPFSPSSLLRGSFAPREVVDVRGRADFSGFDPRPERPHFSNFGRSEDWGGRGGWHGGGERSVLRRTATYFPYSE